MCGCKLVDGDAVMLTKVPTVCLRTPGWVGDVSKHSSKAMKKFAVSSRHDDGMPAVCVFLYQRKVVMQAGFIL
jgi:hypothetical protein